MALETVVFQQQGVYNDYACYNLQDIGGYDFGNLMLEYDENYKCRGFDELSSNSVFNDVDNKVETVAEKKRRRKRARKSCKNKEEIENQRMTHIAVERNRRRQMNEYLATLRSIMPPSYVQRGDQASVVGGAINFVKELEHLVRTLEAQKKIKLNASPFEDFFTSPQHSSNYSNNNNAINQSVMANIEVNTAETHANLKILSRQRPKQISKMVVGLQTLRFIVLHLNVNTVDQMVLYSFSLKAQDDCQFTNASDIAAAVYHMIEQIQEETVCN